MVDSHSTVTDIVFSRISTLTQPLRTAVKVGGKVYTVDCTVIRTSKNALILANPCFRENNLIFSIKKFTKNNIFNIWMKTLLYNTVSIVCVFHEPITEEGRLIIF